MKHQIAENEENIFFFLKKYPCVSSDIADSSWLANSTQYSKNKKYL